MIDAPLRNYGNLNYTINEFISIGRGKYGIDTHGYIDEFMVWNRSNFTPTDVYICGMKKKLGTPPDKDIYVKAIKYELPYDWMMTVIG